MELNTTEVKEMLSFYQEEKLRLNAKLKHVDAMLRKLQGNNVDSESGVLLTRTGAKAKNAAPKVFGANSSWNSWPRPNAQ